MDLILIKELNTLELASHSRKGLINFQYSSIPNYLHCDFLLLDQCSHYWFQWVGFHTKKVIRLQSTMLWYDQQTTAAMHPKLYILLLYNRLSWRVIYKYIFTFPHEREITVQIEDIVL